MNIEDLEYHIEKIEITRSDLYHIAETYKKLQALDLAKENVKLQRLVSVHEDRERKYLKTISERDLEIARLGLSLGEALKLIPTPHVGPYPVGLTEGD